MRNVASIVVVPDVENEVFPREFFFFRRSVGFFSSVGSTRAPEDSLRLRNIVVFTIFSRFRLFPAHFALPQLFHYRLEGRSRLSGMAVRYPIPPSKSMVATYSLISFTKAPSSNAATFMFSRRSRSQPEYSAIGEMLVGKLW